FHPRDVRGSGVGCRPFVGAHSGLACVGLSYAQSANRSGVSLSMALTSRACTTQDPAALTCISINSTGPMPGSEPVSGNVPVCLQGAQVSGRSLASAACVNPKYLPSL